MLKLKRLRIERFRSLAKGTELSFSDGINVVLGQNGTGKTTLLELISMVVRSDFSTVAKEEFAIKYELSVPGDIIVVAVRNERVTVKKIQALANFGAREVFRTSAEVFAGASRDRLLRYDTEHGLSVSGNPLDVHPGILTPVDPGFLFTFVGLIVRLVRRYFDSLVQAGKAYRFDESLDLFKRITDTGHPLGDILVGEQSSIYPFVPPLVPDSIVRKLQESHQPKKSDYSFDHSNLELLATLKDMMGFSTSELRVDVTSRPRDSMVQIENFTFRFWWEDGTSINHERLSYGQKRLLTFFYYLACNPAIVIADELVNGLHHRWITASIEAIGQRQAFLTSQNPLLLDYIPITSADEVRRSFVLCRGEPRDGRPGWIWENMSEEDAEELFSAYQVGVEHVSEILQSRGLW